MINAGLLIAALALSGCGPNADAGQQAGHKLAGRVLVIYNANAPESAEIAKTYAGARGIPEKNLLSIRVAAAEDISPTDYRSLICDPVFKHIQSNSLKIDYIVLCRGVPIRIAVPEGYSVDASLMVDAHPKWKAKPLEPMKMQVTRNDAQRVANPYFGSREAFSSDKFGFYLCTRLDGYTKEDAIALIGRATRAAPAKGVFLLDASPNKTGSGYGEAQKTLFQARDLLVARQFEVEFDETDRFIGGRVNLMGYASWGSNDNSFQQPLYNSLRFRPGAISETFVSTSARTLRRTSGGQSLIADLIAQGITGAKGYVSEPYTLALANVDLLFARYTEGRNLAESFYSASPLLKWKDLVIGDPLCAPYASK